MPMPCPMSRHSASCAAVASRSFGNHSSGMDTVRPSSRRTVNWPPTASTETARGSSGAEVLMPLLQELRLVLLHENSSASDFLLPHPVRRHQFHRLQPEFCVPVLVFHVDVRRLHPLVAEEEKAKPLNDKQRRHRCAKVPRHVAPGPSYASRRCSRSTPPLRKRAEAQKLASGQFSSERALASGLQRVEAQECTGEFRKKYDESQWEFRSSKTGIAITTPLSVGTCNQSPCC